MLSEKMVKSINHQINREHYSAYLYLSIASYAAAEGLRICQLVYSPNEGRDVPC